MLKAALDGSTDSGVVEELVYILYVSDDGKLGQSYQKLKSVDDGTAEGLTQLLLDTVVGIGLGDSSKHAMEHFDADGANVNMGGKKGVAVQLREAKPWLMSVLCFNHRLELAVQDSFIDTYYTELCTVFTQLYYLYHNSPKRLQELAALASVTEAYIVNLQKAQWNAGAAQAGRAILQSYTESMCVDPIHDQAKANGLLTKIMNFKFAMHLVFFQNLSRQGKG